MGMGKYLIRASMAAATACWLVSAGSGAANAEDNAPPAAALSVELNSLQQVNAVCRVVFMVENRLAADLKGVSFETVLINRDGVVDRLTVFDFKALPKGRARVRQFELPDTQCGTIGRVLINGAASCEGDGIAPSACIDGLSVSSRTDVEISG